MTDSSKRETRGFQAEVKQLLHLMIHSLYSNREIFLRELISNASDAADKLRFAAIATPALIAEDPELCIRIEADPEAGTLTISDNGIGMDRNEVIEQLGTIARSGTAEFIRAMSSEEKADSRLIGQFGVGFYSSFIVADRVEVITRRAGLGPEAAVRWSSDGQGEFSVEPAGKTGRGTTVVLHLRDDAREFAEDLRLRSLIRKYSDHIAFPVLMQPMSADTDGEDGSAPVAVNSAKALWTRPRSDIEDDEYREFYKHIAHDFQDPLAWSHNRVEGKREYTSLLYIPSRAPFDLWNRDAPRGVKLYIQRVFIMDNAEQFLPLYLRFVRGVVDAGDLSLNVSRELLQQDANVQAMRSGLTRRVLDMLERLARERPDDYRAFWQEFGRVLKEGPAEDPENRERIADLLRFTSTSGEARPAIETLAEYVDGRAEGQDCIYYLTADSPAAARSSPHLEKFRESGTRVLLLTDPIDEWLIGHLGEYRELPFRDVRRSEAAARTTGADGQPGDEAVDADRLALLSRLQQRLGDRVAEVRATDRLTDSAGCLALGEFELGTQMRRLLEASGQAVPESKPIFEINPQHPLMRRLASETDDDRFGDLAEVLFEQASLADGRPLEDPGRFVQRLNRLLIELAE